jgi:hypothetical protein
MEPLFIHVHVGVGRSRKLASKRRTETSFYWKKLPDSVDMPYKDPITLP